MLNLGNNAANGNEVTMEVIEQSYSKILEMVSEKYKLECKEIIDEMLDLAAKSLTCAHMEGKFEDELRAKTLAYSGEVLMSHVLNYILRSNDIMSDSGMLDDWPIIFMGIGALFENIIIMVLYWFYYENSIEN